MATSFLPTTIAFFQETTQGTGPANAAAWVSSGNRFRVMAESIDLSAFTREMIEDERSREDVLGYDAMIQGIKGRVEFAFETYLHGAEASTDSGSQVAETDLMTILEHCFGGLDLGYSDAAAALGSHSTTAVEVGTVGNFSVGQYVGLEDSDGMVHGRRIASIAGDVLTLDRALPFTPSDGDPVHAGACIYIDESVLVDSAAGPYTFSYLIEKGLSGSRSSYEANGCVSTVSGISLDLNAAAKLQFSTLVGSYITPESAPTPSWSGTPSGAAGLAIGPGSRVHLGDFGSTTNTNLKVTEFSVTPGITRSRVETRTEADDGMPGTGMYTLERNPCEVSLQLAPHADDNWTDFNAGTLKHLCFERIAAAGSAWMLDFPRVEITNDPQLANTSNVLGNSLSLRALPNTAGSSALLTSRMCIVLF